MRFVEAGGDSIVLFPAPADRTEEMLHLTAEEVIPRL